MGNAFIQSLVAPTYLELNPIPSFSNSIYIIFHDRWCSPANTQTHTIDSPGAISFLHRDHERLLSFSLKISVSLRQQPIYQTNG